MASLSGWTSGCKDMEPLRGFVAVNYAELGAILYIMCVELYGSRDQKKAWY